MAVYVRVATPEELVAVLNVLDGAALETDRERILARLRADDVRVAVAGTDSERVIGACVLDGPEIVSIAVRRRRRSQGIGTALLRDAASERERLLARFDPGVCPFYEALGFEVTPTDDGRCDGVLDPAVIDKPDLPAE
ncbi:GNAT family N-acetyltransferase [Halorhabdus sp. CUG00001]|uniref:GNAT family N-acetyltransferase n=1 Tax=Halorhabdus sp. CUG00001 TaxID=2600297 RepID=UPI00131E7B27|nr:GNAT family N-acetyltransferase [Halorhabdus sp. CUG00001]